MLCRLCWPPLASADHVSAVEGIGTKKILQFLDRERLLLQDTQESKGSRWCIDLDAQFNRYKGGIDVGWVKKLEMRDGNLAVLTAND
jgi:hypothetical protein